VQRAVPGHVRPCPHTEWADLEVWTARAARVRSLARALPRHARHAIMNHMCPRWPCSQAAASMA
jgi:hypothetical protein